MDSQWIAPTSSSLCLCRSERDLSQVSISLWKSASWPAQVVSKSCTILCSALAKPVGNKQQFLNLTACQLKLELQVCQITAENTCPILLIISSEIPLTMIILFHAHPQVVYCKWFKFHQYWFIHLWVITFMTWTESGQTHDQNDSFILPKCFFHGYKFYV